MAKRIIRLINAVGDAVSDDPNVNRYSKAVFVPNYGVQSAQLI